MECGGLLNVRELTYVLHKLLQLFGLHIEELPAEAINLSLPIDNDEPGAVVSDGEDQAVIFERCFEGRRGIGLVIDFGEGDLELLGVDVGVVWRNGI